MTMVKTHTRTRREPLSRALAQKLSAYVPGESRGMAWPTVLSSID